MIPPMAITPLYTIEELNTEIAAWKLCLAALRAGKSYTFQSGGSQQSYTANDIDTVQKTLLWFQRQRAELEGGSASQVVIGRPQR